MKNIDELKNKLQTANLEDNKIFVDLLNEVVKISNLSIKDIAHHFGISKPSVERWLSGINAPHPVMRRHVYNFLIKQIENIKV